MRVDAVLVWRDRNQLAWACCRNLSSLIKTAFPPADWCDYKQLAASSYDAKTPRRSTLIMRSAQIGSKTGKTLLLSPLRAQGIAGAAGPAGSQGATGATGPSGPSGAGAFVYEGTYTSARTYAVGQVITTPSPPSTASTRSTAAPPTPPKPTAPSPGSRTAAPRPNSPSTPRRETWSPSPCAREPPAT